MIGRPLPVTSWKSFLPSAALAVAACARRAPGMQRLVAAVAAPRINWRRECFKPSLMTPPQCFFNDPIGAGELGCQARTPQSDACCIAMWSTQPRADLGHTSRRHRSPNSSVVPSAADEIAPVPLPVGHVPTLRRASTTAARRSRARPTGLAGMPRFRLITISIAVGGPVRRDSSVPRPEGLGT